MKYANYWPVKEIVRTKLYDIKRNLGQKERKLRVAVYQASAACEPPALPPQGETAAPLCLLERWDDPLQTLEVRISWLGELFTLAY